jgi:hypothetical protein
MDSGVVERLGTLLLDEDLPFGAHDVVEAAIARISALEGELKAAREALEAIAKPLTGNRYAGHQFKWAQDIAIRALSGERP